MNMLNEKCFSSLEQRIRILFVSPRPFGLMGTPGTYYLAESYSKFADLCVVANKATQKDNIVYQPDDAIKIHELEFYSKGFLDSLLDIVIKYEPQIVIVGNHGRWYDIVSFLKKNHSPSTAYILDIKSPIVTNRKAQADRIRSRSVDNYHLLDLVMTRCKEDVIDWLPQCTVKVLQYKLGIKPKNYPINKNRLNNNAVRRFVYVGTIHPLRKLDILIDYISLLPEHVKNNIKVDFYGGGPAVEDLTSLARRKKLHNIIDFKGVVECDLLPSILSNYDAGIAWVPHEIYGSAPSLKLLEYLAAGIIPMAMDTIAHKRYAQKGFNIDFFSNSPDSFCKAIKRVFNGKFSASKTDHNLKEILNYDWDLIASNQILPSLVKLSDQLGSHSKTATKHSSSESKRHKEHKQHNTKSSVSAENKESKMGFQNNYLDSINNKIIKNVHSWSASVPDWIPLKKSSNSKLRIACIVEDRLYQGLRFEGELLLLTPENWKYVMKYGKPDFLLVESIWKSATNHWYLSQNQNSSENKIIVDIINLAKQMSIPTVFWFTKDHAYHDHYNLIARNFDFVFCSDPREIDLLYREGVKSKILLPAVQPALFNPLRHFDQYNDLDLNIVFDGWGDLDAYKDDLSSLEEINRFGLAIYDSKNVIFQNRKQFLPQYDGNILGCVTNHSKINILKYANLYLSFNLSRLTSTEHQWMALESIASQTPIVHYGELSNNDIRKGIIIERHDELDFLKEIVRFSVDKIYRDRLAQTSWRKVYSEHTFSHRLQDICKTIGVNHGWEEFPSISMITPTCRESFIPMIIENFNNQTYPNKELIIVFNGNISLDDFKIEHNDKIRLYKVPTDYYTGGCMNYGVSVAQGEYSFKVDDDDFYGNNYILDMMLYTRSVDLDLFGKSLSRYVLFESDKSIYQSKNRKGKSLSIVNLNNPLFNTNECFTGNSISGKTEVFKRYKYLDNGYRCSDTSFFLNADMENYNVAILDKFNMVVQRRKDISSHTWQMDEEKIKDRSIKVNCKLDDLYV